MNFAALALALSLGETRPLEFNRDIRPILSDACFHCHGPDRAKAKADLSFDTEEGARAAIVPHKPNESLLIERIHAKDPKKKMPPPASGLRLTPAQMTTLRQWIAEGAAWQKHWAFIPPRVPEMPKVKNPDWVRNPIDSFVQARLEKEGLKPSPEADRITLLRRVSLDLTGLPPSPAEVDAFLNDKREDAYERVVDRLLASTRYGERLAKPWLDAARYADTNGYQSDGDRIMWRWRDWVIDAFNNNMPFDQFTIEQLAGDMLPKPTLEQLIATGFNRNHRGNAEGGVIPEEYAVEYVVDRVDTTATVWLGLTAGCAKCHSHKYDPISQKEFYQLFAYFNNVPEKGKAIKYGNSPPMIKAPTKEEASRWESAKAKLRAAEEEWSQVQDEIDRQQKEWERTNLDKTMDWDLERRQIARLLRGPLNSSTPLPNWRDYLNSITFDGGRVLEAGNVADFGFFDSFTMGAHVLNFEPLRTVPDGTIFSRMTDTDRGDGFRLAAQNGCVQIQLVKRWLDDAIRVKSEQLQPCDEGHQIFFSYDGSRLASGLKLFVNGKSVKLHVELDDLNQSFKTQEPFRIGGGGGSESRFKGRISEVKVFDRVLTQDEIAAVSTNAAVRYIAKLPPSNRTHGQNQKLRFCFLDLAASVEIKKARNSLLLAQDELAQLEASLPTSMVMQEMPSPRDTHILLRGEYDKPGAKVQPGLPEAFPPLPKDAPNNRLGFAKWLVAPENPLTARVTVNRFWQMLFGTGIVKTVEDFGSQGDWPTHPELLDWLATDFVKTGWNVKKLLKTIVTSAAYRQSSRLTPELHGRDPDNRLLARGARVRLSAEMIRDQALFASGLLVEKVGGPSVKPYQPEGLAKELHGSDDYKQDHGPNLYRRGLYTYWKRTVSPPGMMNFDAANREICVVRESRTNTPLQALNLLNDVTFLEAARVLAQRTLEAKGLDDAARLNRMFRTVLSRSPQERELAILGKALAQHRERYRSDPKGAVKLASVGEWPGNTEVDAATHAAYTAVANLILNLDEAITKE